MAVNLRLGVYPSMTYICPHSSLGWDVFGLLVRRALSAADGNSDAVSDAGDSGAPEEVSFSPSLMSPNLDFVPHFPISWSSAELPTKTALKPELLQLQSTTRVYTAAVDLGLKGSKDQCGHPSASEESKRVSKYPEGKRAFKIRSGACGLIWLARASGLFTLAALRGALPKSLLSGEWPSLDIEKRV